MNREETLFCSQQANRVGFIPGSIQKALGIRLISIFQSPSSLGEAVNFESNQEPLDSKVVGALLCKNTAILWYGSSMHQTNLLGNRLENGGKTRPTKGVLGWKVGSPNKWLQFGSEEHTHWPSSTTLGCLRKKQTVHTGLQAHSSCVSCCNCSKCYSRHKRLLASFPGSFPLPHTGKSLGTKLRGYKHILTYYSPN